MCHLLTDGFGKIATNTNTSFVLLLLKDRLSTRDLLRRKGMVLQSHSYVLCNQNMEETLEHLFLLCPMAWLFGSGIHLVSLFQLSLIIQM